MNDDALTAQTSTYQGFEGSYLGDVSRISDDSKMECKICWHVYDPAQGDDYWQIPLGTPFSQLPAHWRCPNCDGDATQFMVVHDD
ncbi:MAG: rubredoxin [Moraxella sp.]